MSTIVPSSADAPATTSEGLGALRALVIAHGAFNVILGLLLIFIPGRTLTLIAVLAGISLCLMGLVDLARAMLHGLTAGQRTATIVVGLLALAAGVVVIARPEGSLKAIVIAAGLYVMFWGVARMVLSESGPARRPALIQGAIAFVAGGVLLAWPDVTVGAMAVIYGVFLLILGAAEIYFGARRHSLPS